MKRDKKELYEEYLFANKLKGTLELANAFYLAYALGYANSSEDNYSESDKPEKILSLNQKLQRVGDRLEKEIKDNLNQTLEITALKEREKKLVEVVNSILCESFTRLDQYPGNAKFIEASREVLKDLGVE